MKGRGKPATTVHEIIRVVTRFLSYISCYIVRKVDHLWDRVGNSVNYLQIIDYMYIKSTRNLILPQ